MKHIQYETTDKLIKNEVLDMAERLEKMENLLFDILKKNKCHCLKRRKTEN